MSNFYKREVEDKNLYILPIDLSTMFKTDGSLNTRLLKRKARMTISNSSPIINPVIVENKHLISVAKETSRHFSKAVIAGHGKSVLVEAQLTDTEINAVTDVDSLTALINSKNNLIFISSIVSIYSENVVDIYYSKKDECFMVAPELTLLGTTLPENEFLIDMAGWKVGLLNLNNLQTDFNFTSNIGYLPMPSINIDHPAGSIAEAKSDASVYSILLQGLATFPYISEYMRKTANGDVNMLKDTPVQIVVLEELTENMFVSDKMDHHFVVQATPFTYKLQQINNVKLNKIAFPIFF